MGGAFLGRGALAAKFPYVFEQFLFYRWVMAAICASASRRAHARRRSVMRLDGVAVGDLVLCRIKGRSVYGEVLEVAGGRVNFRPLSPAVGWHRASAREIVSHWRKTGRHRSHVDVEGEEVVPVAREQLSLPGVHK